MASLVSMIDATYPKAHRTATGLGVEKGHAVAATVIYWL